MASIFRIFYRAIFSERGTCSLRSSGSPQLTLAGDSCLLRRLVAEIQTNKYLVPICFLLLSWLSLPEAWAARLLASTERSAIYGSGSDIKAGNTWNWDARGRPCLRSD